MKCPECQGEQCCPCKNCAKLNADKPTWIWVTGNGPIKCSHCGHEMGVGEFQIEEFKQYDEWRMG
ncbi:hypothetical protein H8E88_27900 [candidate division KSB1 bacterium]|nr:hypothetical protein [candidate division KSB1 bacterium]